MQRTAATCIWYWFRHLFVGSYNPISLIVPPRRCANYCDEYVCLSPRITQKPQNRSSDEIFMHVAYDRDSVLLCRLCDTLCTSGFADDVFSLNSPIATFTLQCFHTSTHVAPQRRLLVSAQVYSASHPQLADKPSRLPAGYGHSNGGRRCFCRVAGNSVWSHMACRLT